MTLSDILPTVSSRFRALLGARGFDPGPDLDVLASRCARSIMDEVFDLDHPSTESMIKWRVKAVLVEAVGHQEEKP
jgi:hypothetical protein